MSTFLVRLCFLMAAAFGSRPCGVQASEQPQAPLIVGLRARQGDHAAESRDPRTATVAALVRAPAVLRVPGESHGGAPDPASAEIIALRHGLERFAHASTRIPRRTPCAACGDGSPYDATAPPVRVIARA